MTKQNKQNKNNKHQTLNQLATWFKQKSVEELSDIVMRYVVDSENEFSKWQLAMLNDQGGMNSINIKTMIDKALPDEGVWDWREVDGYFDYANDMFETIFLAINKCADDSQWDLILYALVRLNDVLEQIDDSNGCRLHIEEQLIGRLTKAFKFLNWCDEKKAQWIFEHYNTWKYDVFPAVPEDFELTDNTKDIFASLCKDAADKQIKAGVDLSDWSEKHKLERLLKPLITAEATKNNFDQQCRLMAVTAHNARDYIHIAKFCIKQCSLLDAEHWLQQAYQAADEARDINVCKHFEVTLRIELKEYQQAWQIAWQLFTQQPSFSGYKELITLEQTTGVIDAEFRAKTEQLLNDCYAENNFGGIAHNADALLQFYIYHNKLDKARAWVLCHKAQSDNLIALADLVVTNYPQAAADLYSKVVSVVVEQGNNRAYQEATDLLVKLDKAFKNIDDISINPVIYKVIHQHKAKRNMMKLLKTHFGQCF